MVRNSELLKPLQTMPTHIEYKINNINKYEFTLLQKEE